MMYVRTVWSLLLLPLVAEALLHGKLSPWQKLNRLAAAKSATYVCDGKPGPNDLSCTKNWITQPVDHFNKADTRNWSMQYEAMDQYFNNVTKNPIIFLMIGGEDAIAPYWILDPKLQYLQWAKNFSAMVYQTEHRFFGESHPLPDMSTANLKYLNTTQALEDLAFFIKSMNAKNKWVNPRWVTFGGSYPGSMAAWFRSKYPKLTVGSVASSAPLNLKLDFYEYTLVMENTIRNESQKCAQLIDDAFGAMTKMALTTDGRNKLSKIFNAQPKFYDNNVTQIQIYNFFGTIFNVYQDTIQYTYDGRYPGTYEQNITVHSLCNTVLANNTGSTYGSDEDLATRIKNWYNQYNLYGNSKYLLSVDNSYQDGLPDQQNVLFNGTDAAGRGWFWLCCNEIGFLQTTELGKNIFHDILTMNFQMQSCVDVFGPPVGPKFIRDHNIETQKYYGGVDYFNATNLFLPNGSLDPWHALGYYKDEAAKHVKTHLIQGTAHCGDMYAPYTDSKTQGELDKVHKMIYNELVFYLTGKEGTM